MSLWTDRRSGKYHRTSHAVRQETSFSGEVGFNGNDPPEIRAKKARQLLQRLGMGYSCLGLYLSSRIDLLLPEFCREFSLIADSGPPPSPSELEQSMDEELSPGLKGAFVQLNFASIQSTLLSHSLSAELANGAPVTVTILRPEYSALKNGPLVPPSFDKAIVREYCGSEVDDAVFLDFFASLRRKCNFKAQLGTMELMSYDSAGCNAIVPRRVYPELSTDRVITLEQLEGVSIDDVVRSRALNTAVLSRSLCQAWLHQALCGKGFAVDLQRHNIAVKDNAALFTGCDFVSLSPITRENLWNYFMATMVDDPDKAAMYLLREMWPVQHKRVDSETFRSKFRQSAYFGSLEPLLGTNCNALAQLIFQHWKTALEYGYSPKPPLLCFYRGLFSIARVSQKLSPFGDPLREGIEEVRNDRIFGQMKDLADWRYWFQNSDKFANAMVSLPRIVDDALTRGSAPHGPDPALDEPSRRQVRAGGPMADMTMICALVGVFLLFQSSGTNPFTQRAAMLLLLLVGLIALRKCAD